MKTLVELCDVSKTYHLGTIKVQALKKANLQIKKGEFVAIMGPSGSGKSTLMHLLGCLDTPTSGKIFLEGKEVSNLSEEELARVRNKKIGFVFQSFNLITRTTALENICLPLVYGGFSQKKRNKKALKALEDVKLKK